MSKPMILVAEDDDRFRTALAIRLEHAGYHVVEATDGETAVSLARREKPNLLILDVHMPRADGLSVLDHVDDDDALRDCPVIYITGDKSIETEIAATRRGAFWVFHKPVEMGELLDLIENLTGPTSHAA